jgi:hypothetical protein
MECRILYPDLSPNPSPGRGTLQGAIMNVYDII